MKKRYLILAGLLVCVAAAAGCGCGKKSKDDGKQSETQVTVAPASDDQKKDGSSGSDTELVDMEKSTDEDITNIMGEKTSTSSKVVVINKTGSEVARIYIRPNSDDDDDWGDDLVNGMFTLKDGDKALYYFEKNAKDASGNTVSSYDIRISYTDENKSECFFRKIPLQNISQITLKMDGSGDSSIPYATYLTGSSKKETSTLTEVKKRLGLIDDDGQSTDGSDNDTDVTPTPGVTSAPATTTAPTPTPDPNSTDPTDNSASVAEQYIGQSLDSLIAACGEPQGSDYQNEPETGETGYHYYPSFTVSTTVDESGNEIVAGVW